MSIFKNAKSEQENEKVVLEINDSETYEMLETLDTIDSQITKLEKDSNEIKTKFKTLGNKKFIEFVEETGQRPKSIHIIATNDMDDKIGILYTINDKYIKVDTKNQKQLISKYGEDIIEENIVYKLNNEMVNKYADIISELITNCKDIKEEDKFNIITSSTEYSIKKGTIDELYTLNEKYQVPVNEIYSDIKPVESLQKPKKIK